MAWSTGARQTGHASASSRLRYVATHRPHNTWPQGTNAVSRPGWRQHGHSAAFVDCTGGGGGGCMVVAGVPMGATIVPKGLPRRSWPDDERDNRAGGGGVKTGSSCLSSSRHSP